MSDAPAPLRSFLFVPANQPKRIPKALVSGADAVILDLEDTVPPAEKPAARKEALAALGLPREAKLYVRVNPAESAHCYDDLVAVVAPGLDGIMLPKVDLPRDATAVDWVLSQLERRQGIPPGAIDLLPIIESASGLAHLDEIARCTPRIRRLTFGAADLSRDLGLILTSDEVGIADARARMTLASRAAGREPPIDTVYIDVRNLEGLAEVARHARVLGFQGKLCIHPDQVAVVNAAFMPSAEEIARAERILAAFEKAEASGIASIEVDGGFVDYPIVAQAQRTLALAKRGKTGGQ
jgi:citrate lyase subunit beta/citryl-CoA lyase